MPYLQLLRPAQWSKNVFLFAGLLFGQRLDEPAAVLAVVLAFGCFCLISSAIYVFNDIHDRREDQVHPEKARRPVASGRVGVPAAGLLGAGLLLVGLGAGAWLDRGFLLVQLAYVVLQSLYTLGLKHVAILDVILIGAGFVLRAIAGAVVIHVAISPWLVLCTFTLCLFLGFSKRRCELNVLGLNAGRNANRDEPVEAGLEPDGAPGPGGGAPGPGGVATAPGGVATAPGSVATAPGGVATAVRHGGPKAVRHRRTLADYTPDLLNHMTTLTAGIAVVSFMLYAVDPETSRKFFGEAGHYYLAYTLPLVVYAIFRFALLVEHGRCDGPTTVVLRDRPFQAAIGLWVIAVLVIIYRGPAIRMWLQAVFPHGEAA
ncbi:MAG: decaprenyl-phosphate phosphoribosyltransferase [Planctomycetota bacterium]